MQKFINLSELDGNNGFSVYGANDQPDRLGYSVSSAGDINGDGYADIIMGAPYASPGNKARAGAAYIMFGKASGFRSSFDLSTLNGNNGFSVYGANQGDSLGYSVNTAGDVNNDGYADIILGARYAAPGNKTDAGAAYIMFGKASGFPANFDLATLDGNNGFAVYGANADDMLGISVSTAGDINNDGYADIILGARYAAPGNKTDAGAAYVIFGKASGFPANLDLTTLDGNNGFTVYGANWGDFLGYSVNTAGDINNDGYADIILGAYRALGPAGAAYVIFGKPTGFPTSFDVTTLDGTNGFAVYGDGYDYLGTCVTEDVYNNDGYADMIVGVYNVWRVAGAAYVIFGKPNGFPASFDLTTLDGNNGFSVNDINGLYLGWSVSRAEDINNDGYADIIIVAPDFRFGSPLMAKLHRIFGKASGFPASFDVATLDGNNGFSVYGVNAGDLLGYSVGTAADINNDGYADIIMGARADPRNKYGAGAAYILFGRSDFTQITSPTTSTPTASSASSIPAGSSYLLMAGALGYLAGEAIHDWMKSDTKAKPIEPIAEKATRQGSSFMSSRSKTLAVLASSKTDYPSFSKAAQPESVNDNPQSSMRAGMSMR